MTTNPSIKLSCQAAVALLRELGPLHYRQIFDRILDRGNAMSTSKIPGASLKGAASFAFQRLVAPFGSREAGRHKRRCSNGQS